MGSFTLMVITFFVVIDVDEVVVSCQQRNHTKKHKKSSLAISQLTRKIIRLAIFCKTRKMTIFLLCANLDISVLWHTLTFTSTFLKAFSSVITYALCSATSTNIWSWPRQGSITSKVEITFYKVKKERTYIGWVDVKKLESK